MTPSRLASLLFLFAALWAPNSQATCIPFPCPECGLRNSGQLNLVLFDRDQGDVRLIPNIRVVGESPSFALVVPTPGLPTLSVAPSGIWNDTAFLTARVWNNRFRSTDGFGCSQTDRFIVAAPEAGQDDVIIHSDQRVGAFHARILSSTHPGVLVDTLEAWGFPVAPDEEARLAPLVQDGWFFTAMELDTTRVQMPPFGWDASVDPVEFRWEGDAFEVPIGALAIHRDTALPMTFFVVDAHRATLDGFRTTYANRITASELEAIRVRYPSLWGYLSTGDFFTRLDRTFGTQDPMEGRIGILRAPDDDEFRLGLSGIGGASGVLGSGVFGLGLLALLLRAFGIWLAPRRRPGI